ncbi:DUF2809 domain-containing protein [Salinimicrobium sp. CDJ15-81-2]|nr:DUF2809 domain-containing protein [Salinimicrobium nanhaiense]
MIHFQKKYFFAAILLFLLLTIIAAFVKDSIIRPYGGDLLVVVFLYCLLKSFFRIPVKSAIFGVLLFAIAVEALQYLRIVKLLGLEENNIAIIILGSYFEWLDIVFYSLGATLVYVVEMGRAGNAITGEGSGL